MWDLSEGNGGKPNLGNKDLLSHARIVKCKKLKCNQNVSINNIDAEKAKFGHCSQTYRDIPICVKSAN